MANQEIETAHFNKASELVSKAYHEENIHNELQAIPENERRDILDKMQQIDKGMHALPHTAGQHFPTLEIMDQGITFVGVKGDKLTEPNKMNLINKVEDQQIKKSVVTGTEGSDTKWLGSTIAPKQH